MTCDYALQQMPLVCGVFVCVCVSVCASVRACMCASLPVRGACFSLLRFKQPLRSSDPQLCEHSSRTIITHLQQLKNGQLARAYLSDGFLVARPPLARDTHVGKCFSYALQHPTAAQTHEDPLQVYIKFHTQAETHKEKRKHACSACMCGRSRPFPYT